jgi:hypothetical protein
MRERCTLRSEDHITPSITFSESAEHQHTTHISSVITFYRCDAISMALDPRFPRHLRFIGEQRFRIISLSQPRLPLLSEACHCIAMLDLIRAVSRLPPGSEALSR